MRGGIIRLAILLCVAASLFCLMRGVSDSASRILPNAYVLSAPSTLDLTFLEVERLVTEEKEKAEKAEDEGRAEPLIAAAAASYSIVRHPYADGASFKVRVMRTSGAYDCAAKLSMMNGIYFDVDAAIERNRVIVISDALATKLFQSADAVGKSVRLYDESYTIVGVYAHDDSLVSRISSDGSDTVYIPYLQSDEAYEQNVSILLWADAGTSFKAYLADTVSKVAGRTFYAPRAADYSSIQSALRFESVPLDYLPRDRIFDLSHYADAFCSMLQARNAWGGFDYYWNVSVNSAYLEIALALAFVLVCAAAVSEGVVFIVKGVRKRS